jgi:DNA (cytosine-5)-methyltransferase 1
MKHGLGRTFGRGERHTPSRVRHASSRGGPTTYELFAGAGLLGAAFRAEGARLVRAIELDATAAETYASQLGDHVDIGDVCTMTPRGRCDIILAGPPCQGFSTLGRRAAADPRNSLALEVVRFTKTLRPKVVVIENVAAFVGTSHHAAVLRAFERLGYETNTVVLEALDFGVAQRRSRSFTFASVAALPVVRSPRRGHVTSVADAFDGLPLLPDGVNHHYAPVPGPLALARMRLIPEGGDKRDVMRKDPSLVPPSWLSMGVEVTDAWGRLRWDEPSNTLRTGFNNASKGRYIHPEEHRVITLREAARLHSIPDSYQFAGWPNDIARQIGNSVPPRLGRAVARAVMRTL